MEDADVARSGARGENLRFFGHPFAPFRYAAYDGKRVRVEGEDPALWGEFDRSGAWLEGPLRAADPTFCRWVTSAHIYNDVVAKSKGRS